MPIEVLMPALSPTMTEGTLAKWHVKEGDEVTSGDVIAEIETDKATMEVEAVDEGKVGKLLIAEGAEGVPVNQAIALLLADGEDAGAPAAGRGQRRAGCSRRQQRPKRPSKPPHRSRPPRPRRRQPPRPEPEPEWTGATVSLTVREALRDAMAEEMRRDPDVFLMGEEVAEYQGAYKVSQGLLDEFGARRVIDTPITEHGFAGVGVGAAFYGLKPIVEFMTFNFAMQAIDHIINSAAKTRYMSGGQVSSPIVFRGPNGAASRVAAQHSQDYSNWYANCPGLYVVAPWSAADAKGLLKSAIRDPNPVIFLENEVMYGQSFDVPDSDDWTVPLGKSKTVRAGKDVTITAHSIMVGKALQAAEALAAEGIDAEVIDLRSLRPLDIDAIVASVQRTNRLVTVEEGWAYGGIGAEVAMQIMERAFDWLDAPVARVTGVDVPMPYAANLERLTLPQPETIVAAAKQVCYAD